MDLAGVVTDDRRVTNGWAIRGANDLKEVHRVRSPRGADVYLLHHLTCGDIPKADRALWRKQLTVDTCTVHSGVSGHNELNWWQTNKQTAVNKSNIHYCLPTGVCLRMSDLPTHTYTICSPIQSKIKDTEQSGGRFKPCCCVKSYEDYFLDLVQYRNAIYKNAPTNQLKWMAIIITSKYSPNLKTV